MNALRISAIALIVAGVIALAYGGFSYTKETHNVSMGPLEMSVTERESVNVPVWAGVAAIAGGGLLLLLGGRKF
jgi:TRAP-type C4-dicarboxylate transport system permease small subunit